MSDARRRIVDRMKQLAAVAGVTAAGCGGAYGVVDPMPQPACFTNRPPPKAAVRRDGEKVVVTLDADPAKTNFDTAYCGIDKAPEGSLPIHTEHKDNTFSFTPPAGATAVQLHIRAWMDGCSETLFFMIHLDNGAAPTIEPMTS